MSITRTKIQNSIVASKINIDYRDMTSTKKQIEKQLSQKEIKTYNIPELHNTTIYHIESLYRDNTNDKYDLIKKPY